MPHNHIIPFLSSANASYLLTVTEVLNCFLGLHFLVNSLLGSSQSMSVAVTFESKHINSDLGRYLAEYARQKGYYY